MITSFIRPLQTHVSSSTFFPLKYLVQARYGSNKTWLNRDKHDYYKQQAKEDHYNSRAGYKLLDIANKFKIFRKKMNIVDLGFAPGAWSQVAVENSKNGVILGVDILPCQPVAGASAMQGNILSATTHQNIRNFFNERNATDLKNTLIEKKKQQSNDLTESASTIVESEDSYYDTEISESKIQTHIEQLASGLDHTTIKDGSENIKVDSNNENRDKEKKIPNEESTMSINKFPVDLVLSDMYAPITVSSGFRNNTTNRPWSRMQNTSGLKTKDHFGSMDLCDAALILAIDILKKNGSLVCKFYQGSEDILLEKRLKKVFKNVHRVKPTSSRPESKEMYFVAMHKRENEIDKKSVFK